MQGVTVYRAQFVGLSQADALGACASAGADAGRLPAAGAGDLIRSLPLGTSRARLNGKHR